MRCSASPALLLCDEPTGNLDSVNTATVLDVLDQLRDQGTTVVVITHDLGVSARADRRVRIEDGHLTEEASCSPGWACGTCAPRRSPASPPGRCAPR